MQGGPPPTMMASPSPFASPPVKKQRAGHTPQQFQQQQRQPTTDGVSQRRAELLKLAKGNAPNQPSASELMNQARNSLSIANGPPILSSKIPPPMAGNSSRAPPMRAPGSALRGGGRPSAPPLQENNTTRTLMRSPQSPKPTIPPTLFQNSSPRSPNATAAAAITAAAVKSPQTSTDTRRNTAQEDRLNRRLEFPKTVPTQPSPNTRAKSAPPTRPPPPPPPPPKVKEEPPKAPTVSFQSPIMMSPEETSSLKPKPPETPELTNSIPSVASPLLSTPANGGGGIQQPQHNTMAAGATPFPRNALPPEPSTVDKRTLMFKDLQAIADTPPPKPSPELRLQQQLASTTKEKSEALKRVSQLEVENTELKTERVKNVKFLSPILGTKPESRRYPKSPCPKRLALDNAAVGGGGITINGDSTKYLETAAKSIPFEYELDGRTFIVRRPHGLAREEDLWYKVGQLNAKGYATSAKVSNESTIDVACHLPDGSIFGLYDRHFVRHHTVDEGPIDHDGPLETLLGSVAYVDDSGMDQQYSLDELWGSAMEVRALYCKTVLAAATVLRNQPVPIAPAVAPDASTTKKHYDTVDVGTTTDIPQPKPTTKAAPPPPVMEHDSPDVSSLSGILSIPFKVIWFLIKTMFKGVIYLVMFGIGWVVVSLLYLHFQQMDYGAMDAIENAYKNRHDHMY